MTGPSAHEPSLSVKVRVPGADCSWCFNEAIEHVLQLDGIDDVRGSITGAWLEVTGPGFSAASLLDTLRTHLHGTDYSSHECQMMPVDPQLVPPVDEQVEQETLRPGSGRVIWPMETLTEAMRGLRAKGFVHDRRALAGRPTPLRDLRIVQ